MAEAYIEIHPSDDFSFILEIPNELQNRYLLAGAESSELSPDEGKRLQFNPEPFVAVFLNPKLEALKYDPGMIVEAWQSNIPWLEEQ